MICIALFFELVSRSTGPVPIIGAEDDVNDEKALNYGRGMAVFLVQNSCFSASHLVLLRLRSEDLSEQLLTSTYTNEDNLYLSLPSFISSWIALSLATLRASIWFSMNANFLTTNYLASSTHNPICQRSVQCSCYLSR